MEIIAEPVVSKELNPDLLKEPALCLWQRRRNVLPMPNSEFR